MPLLLCGLCLLLDIWIAHLFSLWTTVFWFSDYKLPSPVSVNHLLHKDLLYLTFISVSPVSAFGPRPSYSVSATWHNTIPAARPLSRLKAGRIIQYSVSLLIFCLVSKLFFPYTKKVLYRLQHILKIHKTHPVDKGK